MKQVVRQLAHRTGRQSLKGGYLRLDMGFDSVPVLSHLNRMDLGYIVPIPLRDQKKTDKKTPPTGTRALLREKNGCYEQTITGKA